MAFGLVGLVGGCKGDPDATPQPKPLPGHPIAAVRAPRPRLSQRVLPQLPTLPLADDPRRANKIALGHALFFDKRLSANSDRACSSCHEAPRGAKETAGGPDPIAIGSGDKPLSRHAPALWNIAYGQGAFYWDGRATTLEATTKAEWRGPAMGIGDRLDAKAAALAAIPGYRKLFAAAFPGAPITAEQVTQALAEYERTLLCTTTPYDRFAAGDKAALTDQQQRGLDLFLDKGQCLSCHAPPYFSTAMGLDPASNTVGYQNVGIGTDRADDKVDLGRMAVTGAAIDWAAFKPPSLRNVTKTAPYFHDGSGATLDAVVRTMTTGGIANKNLNPAMTDRGFTDAERADLIAFLGGLECPDAVVATLP